MRRSIVLIVGLSLLLATFLGTYQVSSQTVQYSLTVISERTDEIPLVGAMFKVDDVHHRTPCSILLDEGTYKLSLMSHLPSWTPPLLDPAGPYSLVYILVNGEYTKKSTIQLQLNQNTTVVMVYRPLP